MVTERTTYDQITILEDGQIQLRRVRILFDADGAELSRLPWRGVLVPGEAVDAYPARIQAVCATVWTPDVVAAFAEARAAREAAALAPP
jgi:hypothetical protein